MHRWASLRQFLDIPAHVTGKGVCIAIIDGDFPTHPDISANTVRKTYLVRASDPNPVPCLLERTEGPWPHGDHGLWAAAAAAGSGSLCHGQYAGVAPEADLFLVAGGSTTQKLNVETSISHALGWVKANWQKYNIRGVLVATYGKNDTGLLPWQVDPLRVLCEDIANEGLLVVAGTGNHTDTTCGVTQAAAPSVLSVGGVIVPEHGDPLSAEPYHCSRGYTFEGKWVPEVLAPAENIIFPYGTEEQFEAHLHARTDRLPKGYARINEGTSFAGPIVLGAAACLWQARPEWSAEQIKAALIHTSFPNTKWSRLKAGLISIRRAMETDVRGAALNQWPNDYRAWREWREKPLPVRLQSLMNENEEGALPILLAFLPGELPTEAAETVKKLLVHPSFRIRTAAICVLAATSDLLTKEHIASACKDESPNVRMAAIAAIRKSPRLWAEMSGCLTQAFADPSLDVRYAAFRLAAVIKHPDFAEKLAQGLEEDARNKRLANYSARCAALTSITGYQMPAVPGWQPGECPYSERSFQARLVTVQRWKQRLSADPNDSCQTL